MRGPKVGSRECKCLCERVCVDVCVYVCAGQGGEGEREEVSVCGVAGVYVRVRAGGRASGNWIPLKLMGEGRRVGRGGVGEEKAKGEINT